MTFIDPNAQYAFDNRRRSALTGLQTQLAGITRQQGDATQNQQFDTQGLTRQFDQMRERLPGGYAQRGLMNSGIYGDGLQKFGMEKNDAFRGLAMRYQQMQGGLQGQTQEANAQYNGTIAGINSDEAMRRANLAAQLRGI